MERERGQGNSRGHAVEDRPACRQVVEQPRQYEGPVELCKPICETREVSERIEQHRIAPDAVLLPCQRLSKGGVCTSSSTARSWTKLTGSVDLGAHYQASFGGERDERLSSRHRRDLVLGSSQPWRRSDGQRRQPRWNVYVRCILLPSLSLLNDRHRLDDWSDHGRDIAQFLTHYIPSDPNAPSDALPVHLPRQDESLGEARRVFGFQQRALVVIGHSFSGAASYVTCILLSTQPYP
jgi:hypothetical protein